MRLLIIEQDNPTRKSLCDFFKTASFRVDTTACGEHGNYLGQTNNYDLIILGYSLPKKTGYEIIKDLRTKGTKTPIIMLTWKNETSDKVAVLNAGADDYITKPFCYEELYARVKAVLRRPREIQSSIITVSGLKIDSSRHSVVFGKQKVYLTRKEFALLEYLAQNKGTIISRSKLLEEVWQGEGNPFSNTIEAHILNLRKKLKIRKTKLIYTIPGKGYKLDMAKI